MYDTAGTLTQKAELTVSQPLRMRDVATLVRTSMRYVADITVHKHDCRADGKSYLEFLTLNTCLGDTLHITARGDDAVEVIDALRRTLLLQLDDGLGSHKELDRVDEEKDNET